MAFKNVFPGRTEKRVWKRAGSLAAGEDGGSMVESALVFPILLTLLFCFMETCLAFYSYEMISEAAREGTRYAMVHGASCPNATSPTCEATATQVNTYVSNLGLVNAAGGTMTVNTTYPNGAEAVGDTVQVTVSYVLPIRMPYVPTASLKFSSTSVAYIIQ
jgi:Flp pilus assembly protein TadG